MTTKARHEACGAALTAGRQLRAGGLRRSGRPVWLSLTSTGEWPSVLADSSIRRSGHHCDFVET
ncbi:hypothetical protein ACVWWO_003194 [Bradyrhizobium sp. F1.13.1]